MINLNPVPKTTTTDATPPAAPTPPPLPILTRRAIMQAAHPITDDVIRLDGVSKRFGTDMLALDDVSLHVARGELVALLGPSGCGKTTALRLIAGLERPDAGAIWLNERCVAGHAIWEPPENRQVGMMFQDYALFPHMTVAANIGFALKGWKRHPRRERVRAMLDLVGLPEIGQRYPHQLSGGQQQRVALARALAAEPAVVLLDEPFSNLDATMRQRTCDEVSCILRAAGATAVFVTHDQQEAMSVADRVAVIFNGRIVQIDTPRALYHNPATPAVARFLGDANLLPGEAQGQHAVTPLGPVALREPESGPVHVLLRPEDLTVCPARNGSRIHVTRSTFYGARQRVWVKLPDGTTLKIDNAADTEFQPGDRVDLRVHRPALAYPGSPAQR